MRDHLKNRFAIFVSIFFLTGQMALSQSLTPSGPVSGAYGGKQNTNLDLGSQKPALTPGNLIQEGKAVNIKVGSTVQTVTGSVVLTPAQLMAVYQVVSSGTQSIVLGNGGNAVGGSFNVAPQLSNYVSSLTVPQNVTAIANFSSGSSLALAGNLTNLGNFYAVSSNPANSVASISAANIINSQGALLTTVLPPGGIPGYKNLIGNLGLSLNAIQNLENRGTISSAAALSITAGSTITNALPAVSSGSAAVIQAVANLNINAPTIVNQGIMVSELGNVSLLGSTLTNLASGLIATSAPGSTLGLTASNDIINNGSLNASGLLALAAGEGSIANSGSISAVANLSLKSNSGLINNEGLLRSASGDINIDSGQSSDLNLNANGGTFEALRGDINLRDSSYNGSGNIRVKGGDFLSEELNIHAGDGVVLASFAEVTGKVNAAAAELHMSASTDNLKIGQTCISGDPSFYNSLGSVQIDGTLSFGGEDLAIIAEQDIFTSAAGTISTASNSGNGGNITLIAGAADSSGTAFNVTPFDSSAGTTSGLNGGLGDSFDTVVVQGPSATGGAIDLTRSGGTSSISSASTAINGNGGNIMLIAYFGDGSDSSLAGIDAPGSIRLSAPITSGGNGIGKNGDVTMLAGAGVGSPPLTPVQAITAGAVNATGGSGGGGMVTIAAAVPSLKGLNGYIAFKDGTIVEPSDTYIFSSTYSGAIDLTGNIQASQVKVYTGGNVSLTAPITANGGISISTFGSSTLSSNNPANALNSTGPISLNIGTTAASIAKSGSNVTVSQGASTFFVGTSSTPASLSIRSGSSLTVANSIDLAGAALSLDTSSENPYSSNIILNGNLSANGGITLIVAGSATAGGNGTVSSSGPMAFTLGTPTATLGTKSGNLTINQGATTLTLGTAPASISSLTVNFAGNITTSQAIDLGSGSLTLRAQSGSDRGIIPGNGNILLAHDLSANGGITLATGGTGTIGGSGKINSSGALALNLGSIALTLGSDLSGNIKISQGSSNLIIGTAPAAISSLSITASGNISTSSAISLSAANASLALRSTAGTITGTSANSVSASSVSISPQGAIAGGVVQLGIASGLLTITQSAASLTLGTLPSNLSSFSLDSAGNSISITSPISIGSGAASLTLSSSGGTITSSAAANTVSAANLSINPQGANSSNSVVISAPANLSLDQGSAGSLLLGISSSALSSLSIDTGSNSISTTSTAITIGSGSSGALSLRSNGSNIAISNLLTANGGISISTSHAGVISTAGAGQLASSTGELVLVTGTSGSSSVSTAVAQLSAKSSGASLVITQSGSLTVNETNLASGSLAITTDSGSNINISAAVRANGGITLSSSGNQTIGGSGNINSSGPIVLNIPASNIVMSTAANLITVDSGAVLTIGTPQLSISSLTINATSASIAETLTVAAAGPINLGRGSISLSNLNGAISFAGDLTANGGIGLLSAAGTIGNTGASIFSSGTIVLAPATGAIAVSAPGGLISITQNGQTVKIGTAQNQIGTLVINAAASITISSAIDISSGSLTLQTSNGQISSAAAANTVGAGDLLSLSTVNATQQIANVGGTGVLSLNSGSSPTLFLGNVGSLSVTAGNSIDSSGTINMGAGSLSLVSDSSTAGIVIGGSISANGGLTLSLPANGSGTIGGAGSLSSSAAIRINVGTQAVSVGSLTVTDGAGTINLNAGFGSLRISSASNITVLPGINDTSEFLSLSTTSGNIIINNDITVKDLLLTATAAGASIGGTGTISSSEWLSVSYGSASSVSFSTPSGISVTGAGTITTTAIPDQFDIAAGTVTLSSSITAPEFLLIHTNNFANNAAINSSHDGGLIQIDNSEFSGGLTLSGGGPPSITYTGGNSGRIHIVDFNGAELRFNSSYSLDPGDDGIIRIWEAFSPGIIPAGTDFSRVANTFSTFQVNPNAGILTLNDGVTLTMSGFAIVSAPQVNIGSSAGSGTTMALSANSDGLRLHTNNLNNNGAITSLQGSIFIDDAGLFKSGIALNGSGTPSIGYIGGASGTIAIFDYNSQFININSSYIISAGTASNGFLEIEEVSLGGSVDPSGIGLTLESTPTEGTITVASGVTLQVTGGDEVEFDGPTQVIMPGAKIVGVTALGSIVFEAKDFTNNGTILNTVANSLINIGNDDILPSPQDADIVGRVNIFGTGSMGFGTFNAGVVSFGGVPGTVSITTDGTGQVSRQDPINLFGNQTIFLNAGSRMFILSNNGVNLANESALTISAGGLTLNTPSMTNNGAITSDGTIRIFNTYSGNSDSTLVTNNGTVFTPAGGAIFSILQSGAGVTTVNGIGTYTATGTGKTAVGFGTDLASDTLIMSGPLTVNASASDSSIVNGPSVTVYGDGSTSTLTMNAHEVVTEGSSITVSQGATVTTTSSPRVFFDTASFINNGTVSSSVANGFLDVDNNSFLGALNLSGTGTLAFTGGSTGRIFIVDTNSAEIDLAGAISMDAGSGAAGFVQFLGSGSNGLVLSDTASLALKASTIILNVNKISTPVGASTISTSTPDLAWLTKTISAGTGTIALAPINDSETISVGAGNIANFNATAAVLALLTAGKVTIGSATGTGGISLAAAISLPAAGSPGTTAGLYDLDFQNGGAAGTYSGANFAMNLQGQDLSITTGGSINTGTGTITGSTGSVSISGGGVTVGGSITMTGAAAVSIAATGNSNVNLNASVGGIAALTSIQTSSSGTGTIGQNAGIVTGASISLSTGSGDIFGTSNNETTPLQTLSSGTLSVNTSSTTTGSAFISNAGALTIGASSVGNQLQITTTTANANIGTAGAITANTGLLQLKANGNISISHPLNGHPIVLLSANGSGGSININSTLTSGSGGVTIAADGTGVSGTVTVGPAGSIVSTGAASPVSISAFGVTLNSTINAGSNTVTLRPNQNPEPISIAGGAGPFVVNSGLLSQVTAGTLQIGDATQTGGMTLSGNLDLQSVSFQTLSLQNAGQYTTSANQAINLGSTNLEINAATAIAAGSGGISGSTGALTMTSDSSIAVSAINTAGVVQVISTGGAISAGNIGAVQAPSSILIQTAAAFTLSTGSLDSTGNVQVLSAGGALTTGLVGATTVPSGVTLQSTGNTISSDSISSTGTVLLSQNSATALTISASSAGPGNITGTINDPTGTVLLVNNGTGGVVIAGAGNSVNAADIDISAVSGGVSVDAGITGGTSISLTGKNISGTGLISAPTVSITATAGNIAQISGSNLPLHLDTSNVSASASQNVYLDNGSAAPVTIGSSSAGTGFTFDFSSSGPIITAGTLNAGNVALRTNDPAGLAIGGTVNAANTLTISSSLLSINGSISAAGSLAVVNQANLSIGGTGSISSPSANFTSVTGNANFTAALTINGNVNVNALQGQVIGSGITTVNGDITFNTPTVNNPNAFVVSGSTTQNVPSGGAVGTIINTTGDVVLNSKTIINSGGKNVAILASGNVIANGLTKVNLSSGTTHGGNLSIIAGYDFTPATAGQITNTSTLFTVSTPSSSGGSIYLSKVSINTSSTAAAGTVTDGLGTHQKPTYGGNVFMLAAGNTNNAGTIVVGSINTSSANGSGGTVQLIAEGGVIVNGSIKTSGKASGGLVSLTGASANLNYAAIQNGFLLNGGIAPANPSAGAGAGVSVLGTITSSSKLSRGGDVILSGDEQIFVKGAINTAGFAATLPLSTGGNVSLHSLDSFVSTAAISTNALNAKINGVAAGVAGNISILAGSNISTGTLLATGAANAGSGGGGAGGNIMLSTDTTLVGATPYSASSVFVTGFINSQGGKGSSSLGGTGGAGGNIDIGASMLTVKGSTSGASILASGGIKGLSGSDGAGGSITIKTYALQPLPSSLDLTSTKPTIPVLPGGMFSVGLAAPVNGVAGKIVSSNAGVPVTVTKSINGNGQIVQGNSTIGQIAITVIGSSGQINTGSGLMNKFITVAGKRSLVTPAEAVALFQTSRGGLAAQTITLSSPVGTDGANAVGGSATFAEVDSRGVKLTAFKLPANVALNFSGLHPALTLPANSLIAGSLNFSTPGATAYLNTGSSALTVSAGAQIFTQNDATLIFSGTGGTLTNNGTIQVGRIVIARSSAAALNFTTGANAKTTFTPGAVNPHILLSSDIDVGMTVTFNANGAAEFDLPVLFGRVLVPTLYQTDALAAANNIATPKTVSLTFNLSKNNGGPIIALPAQVGGVFSGGAVTIKANKNTAFDTLTTLSLLSATSITSAVGKAIALSAVGDLTTGIGSTITSGANLTISTSGATATLNVGNGTILTAGSLKSGAPVTGPVPTTFVNKAGSITLQGNGSGGINIDSSVQITSNGSNIKLANATVAGNIVLNGLDILQSNGGNVSIAGIGQIFIGAGSQVNTRLLGTGQGKVSVGSATTPVQISGAILNAASTNTINGSSVTIDTAAQVSAGTNLSITANDKTLALTLGNGVQLNAGSLNGTPPASGTLSPGQIAKAGTMVLTAKGSGGIIIGDSNILTTNGKDLKITSALGNLSMGTGNQFVANGGNVLIFAKGTVTGAQNNLFHARAVGTTTTSSGGGIEVGSGLTTSSNLAAAFAKAKNTNPSSPTALGSGVSYAGNSNGVIVANTSAPGVINLNPGPGTASILTLNHGVLVFDAMGAGASVSIDQATFQVEAFKPLGTTTMAAQELEIIVDTGKDSDGAEEDSMVMNFAGQRP